MIGYITVTFEIEIEGPDGGLTPTEMVDQLDSMLPKEWWAKHREAEWGVRRIISGTDIPCDDCDSFVTQYEQFHNFDAVLCPRHIEQAIDEAKASIHYQESDK